MPGRRSAATIWWRKVPAADQSPDASPGGSVGRRWRRRVDRLRLHGATALSGHQRRPACGGLGRRRPSRVRSARSQGTRARPPRRADSGWWSCPVLRSRGRCRAECGRDGRRDRRGVDRRHSRRRAAPRRRGGTTAGHGSGLRRGRRPGTPVRCVSSATRRVGRSWLPVAPRRCGSRHPASGRWR